jgi:hypothetical protein
MKSGPERAAAQSACDRVLSILSRDMCAGAKSGFLREREVWATALGLSGRYIVSNSTSGRCDASSAIGEVGIIFEEWLERCVKR